MRIMIVQAGTRAKNTCPGKDTKLKYITELIQQKVSGVEWDVLDLSVKEPEVDFYDKLYESGLKGLSKEQLVEFIEKTRVIQSCKGCVGTAGGYHCHWKAQGTKEDPKVRGCSCYGPESGGAHLPDIMHDEHVYYRLEQADGILFLTPIHWYATSTNLKAMMDRLVCANKTVPYEVIKKATNGKAKDAELTTKLEASGKFDDLQTNHLEGKVAAVFAQGDDGADDYERPEEPFPDTYGDVTRDEFLEKTLSNPKQAIWPLVTTLKYMGVYTPEHLVTTLVRNQNEDYYKNDATFKQDENFLDAAVKLAERLVEEIDKVTKSAYNKRLKVKKAQHKVKFAMEMLDERKISVWLDDERPMPSSFDVHVKTAWEAIELLKKDVVEYISLDHDLGDDEKFGTGMDVARWIEEHAFLGDLTPLSYNLHTANPVGRDNMMKALMNADKYWSSKREEHDE